MTASDTGIFTRKALFRPVDIASLVFFRITFGVIVVGEVVSYAYGNGETSWIRGLWVDPKFHFTYYGFEWVRPWPGVGLYVHFALLGVLGTFVAIGLGYRLSAALLALGLTYVFLLEQAHYLNHAYLICLVSWLMLFVPAHRALSVDAWRRPRTRSSFVPAWPLWLLRFQIGAVYFFGGVAKLNGDWLRGEPLRGMLTGRTNLPLIWPLDDVESLVTFLSWGGLLFDLLVVPALLWRPTRAIAFVLAVLFHLTNAWLFHIDVFPWFMMAATTLFLDPSWPRNLLRRWWPKADAGAPVETAVSAERVRWTSVLLGLFVVVQLLLPLRHFAYPGNVSWSDEGHCFSWRMMLRNKIAETWFLARDPVSGQSWMVDPQEFISPERARDLYRDPAGLGQFREFVRTRWMREGYDRIEIRTERSVVRFHLTDPATGERWDVNARSYLPGWQQRKMAVHPEMLLQFAHFLADEMKKQGRENVEVRVEAWVSLNGRDHQLLVDPTVDLARVRRSPLASSWIRPLTERLDRKPDNLPSRSTGR